jgi:hypothetical protein
MAAAMVTAAAGAVSAAVVAVVVEGAGQQYREQRWEQLQAAMAV